MEFTRLPRFERAQVIPPIELTERDRNIIRSVHRHRFLRSSHVVALLGGSYQQILRRLQLLYHHGYLERPRAQLDYYHRGGSTGIVYGLGSKGGALLNNERGITVHPDQWSDKNHAIGRIFLEHTLLVSDVMVSIELACRQRQIRLLIEQELATSRETRTQRQPFKWRVKMNGGLRLSVVPDRVFALEYLDQSGQPQRTLFFFEADRGTMPVVRNNLSQTSFFRKLLAYEATWFYAVHRLRFGFNRFRVLTVTTIPGRVNSLIEACSKLRRGRGLFLFADKTILENPPAILSATWQSGKAGETGSLLP